MKIGLSGLAGSGKSEATKALVAALDGERVKFAGALKAMLRGFYAYLEVDEETIERKLEGDLKEVPCGLLRGQTPRHAMQTLGTEWGRDLIADDLWISSAAIKADAVEARGKAAIFDDMRFPNEVDAIAEDGGLTIRIVRPDPSRDGGDNGHASEALVAGLEVEYEVANDGTIEDLHLAVTEIACDYFAEELQA